MKTKHLGIWSLYQYRALGPVSIPDKMSYCEILQSFKGSRLSIKMFVLLWNLTGTKVPVNFQSDRTILDINLVASRLCEILQ